MTVFAATPRVRRFILDRARAETLTTAPAQPDKSVAWQTLVSFENQPLSKLDKPQSLKLQKSIDVLIGKRENEIVIPRFLTKISDSKGQMRYALVEESPLLTIP